MSELSLRYPPLKDAGIKAELGVGTLKAPSMEELNFWMSDGVSEAACTHECRVEPDGWCEHGRPSWFLYYGLI